MFVILFHVLRKPVFRLADAVHGGGEILLQKAVEVLPDDTPETLQRRVMEQAEWQLLPRAAELVSEQIVKEKSNA